MKTQTNLPLGALPTEVLHTNPIPLVMKDEKTGKENQYFETTVVCDSVLTSPVSVFLPKELKRGTKLRLEFSVTISKVGALKVKAKIPEMAKAA